MKEYYNTLDIKEAHRSITRNIKLLKKLKSHLKEGEPIMTMRAITGALCLHIYLDEKWINEIYHLIEEIKAQKK